METTQSRIWAKARAFKQTIAAKIFGLAVFLLLLTIGLAGFLLWEAARMEETIKIVAHLDCRSPTRSPVLMSSDCGGGWPSSAGLAL
jgi:hypothetical protein